MRLECPHNHDVIVLLRRIRWDPDTPLGSCEEGHVAPLREILHQGLISQGFLVCFYSLSLSQLNSSRENFTTLIKSLPPSPKKSSRYDVMLKGRALAPFAMAIMYQGNVSRERIRVFGRLCSVSSSLYVPKTLLVLGRTRHGQSRVGRSEKYRRT